MGRTIIISDVHGCASELGQLLDLVGPAASDSVVFVGDLVSRGPDTAAVLKMFRQVGGRAVRGNHEERLLDAYRSRITGKALPPLRGHHEQVLRELPEQDFALLDAFPLYIDLPEHDVRVVHAGVLPGVAFERQEAWTLNHIRSVGEDGAASEKLGDESWAARYSAGPHIVFGHDSRRKLQLYPLATGIDTGCVYGGSLTALVLPHGERVPFPHDRRELLVSVRAKEPYYDPR